MEVEKTNFVTHLIITVQLYYGLYYYRLDREHNKQYCIISEIT